MTQEIKDIIRSIIKEQYNIEVDDNKNLFSTEYSLEVSDMLFLINSLECKLNMSLKEIFKSNDSSILTPNNLTMAIVNLKGNCSMVG